MRHVIWDWNGTLLDDTDACIGALNQMLARRGKPLVTREFFRSNFSFPARQFYRRLDMDVRDCEWDALAREYYEAYLAQPAKLNEQTRAALEFVRARGWRQSVVSALRQDCLRAHLASHGLTDYFVDVVGSDNLSGASKLDSARRFIGSLSGEDVVMIGDAIHDWEVAQAVGVACRLVSVGSHARERLASHAPTFDTLLEALEGL